MHKLQIKTDQRDTISRSIIGNFVLDTVSKATDKAEQQLEVMTKKWQAREISNVSVLLRISEAAKTPHKFAYLMLLNQHANRTPNGKFRVRERTTTR